MDRGNYVSRVERVRQIMSQRGLDVVIITYWPNLFYITGIVFGGFGNPMPLLIPLEGDPTFVSPLGFYQMVRDNYPFLNAEKVSINETPWRKVKSILEEWGVASGKIGIESRHITSVQRDILRELLPKSEFEDCSDIVESIRMVKSEEELKCIRKACEITDEVYEVIMEDILKPGKTELEVSREIVCALIEKGGEERIFPLYTGASFYPQVRFGINTVYTSVRSTNKKCSQGDIILVDYGAVYGGYCADITRAAVVGSPTEKQKKIFEHVQSLLDKTLQIIKPGIKAAEVYNFVCKELKKEGMLKYFIGHRPGHGIGIESWERPYLSPNDFTTIKPNMTLAVEPGIYIWEEGGFGIRLEDNVLVTEKGVENLTKCPKELKVIL
ncbi:hypothetical protein CP083_06260 [Candidatus Bathyarchaeota archaeon B24-2]|nr:MAG: hypothetical protein CP083_06260 [Candidatus Bathyarchaeota archaeon B24-2]